MDERLAAEELPALYRAVLETVARLERAGERAYAFDVRRKALKTYSTRWDDRGRKALTRLNREAMLRLESTRHPVAASRASLPTETY